MQDYEQKNVSRIGVNFNENVLNYQLYEQAFDFSKQYIVIMKYIIKNLLYKNSQASLFVSVRKYNYTIK